MDQHSLQPKIRALAEATVVRLGFDLVAVEWVGGRRGPILRLSIDAPGGVNAEDCARVSDAVSPLLDAADPIEVPYHLEVSSPGIERPVQRRSDFERFQGYRVKIHLREGPGRRRYLGVVGPLDGDELLVHVDGQEHRISLDLVDRAHLVLDLDEYQKLAEGITMIISDLERLIETIQKEKNIPRDVVIEILESAMEAAARKKYGMTKDIEAQYNPDLGEVELIEWRTVVDEVEDDDIEITLEDARQQDPGWQVGDSYGQIVDASELGRIAAQTAKQVIIQKIRDAERELTYNEFKDRKGELITGIVRRFEKGNIIVDLNRAEAILPRREQVMTETYRPGDRIQAFVLDITRATRQPQVVLSRTHPGLLMKLFEMEVPEIYEGIVRIEACAREPGHRAKIAVSSTDSDVDPVGACVGLKGSRVQAVVGELRGEAIDIIPWHPDPARFIVYAIAPAQVARVYIDEGTHTMELIVPDDQLAKAIGRRGQNVRLAAQLTGWRIDIHSESKHIEMLDASRREIGRITTLEEGMVDLLVRAGFQSAQEIADAEAGEIAAILGVEADVAEGVVRGADDVVGQLIEEETRRRHEPEPEPEPEAEADTEHEVEAAAPEASPLPTE